MLFPTSAAWKLSGLLFLRERLLVPSLLSASCIIHFAIQYLQKMLVVTSNLPFILVLNLHNEIIAHLCNMDAAINDTPFLVWSLKHNVDDL